MGSDSIPPNIVSDVPVPVSVGVCSSSPGKARCGFKALQHLLSG